MNNSGANEAAAPAPATELVQVSFYQKMTDGTLREQAACGPYTMPAGRIADLLSANEKLMGDIQDGAGIPRRT